jgi:hypothetical protein
MSSKGHVWTAPSWQELSSRLQHWSVQPCVRPSSAAHEAAGHNALRGSGPGQKHAFKDALAQVGCPDRRNDWLCITCCSPFPTVHITSDNGRRDLVYAALVTLAFCHHGPDHPCEFVGERNGRDLGRPHDDRCHRRSPLVNSSRPRCNTTSWCRSAAFSALSWPFDLNGTVKTDQMKQTSAIMVR